MSSNGLAVSWQLTFMANTVGIVTVRTVSRIGRAFAGYRISIKPSTTIRNTDVICGACVGSRRAVQLALWRSCRTHTICSIGTFSGAKSSRVISVQTVGIAAVLYAHVCLYLPVVGLGACEHTLEVCWISVRKRSGASCHTRQGIVICKILSWRSWASRR